MLTIHTFLADDMKSLLERGLRNLRKRTGDCEPYADELAQATEDLYIKVVGMSGVIQAMVPDDVYVDPEEVVKSIGIHPNDKQEMKEVACLFASKLHHF